MATFPSAAASWPPSFALLLESTRELGGVVDGTTLHFDRDGRRFSAFWTAAHKSAPPKLAILTPAGPRDEPQESKGAPATAIAMGPFRGGARPRIPSPAPLTLRLETTLDRTGKSLRINRETQTGDALFDERIYLECEASDDLVLAVLVDPRMRANVIKCLELGCPSLTLGPEGNVSVELPLPRAELIAPARLAALLDALGAAAEAIPPLVGKAPTRSFAGRLPFIVLAIVGPSWPLYYLFNHLWKPIGLDLQVTGALAGIALWIVSLPILYFVLRGRSVSLRNLVTCVLALALGFPLVATDLLMTLNGALDTSAPEAHATHVTRLRRTTGKSAAQYATVDSWNPGGTSIELSISLGFYRTLSVETPVVVTTRRGFLGWEWGAGMTVATAPRTSN